MSPRATAEPVLALEGIRAGFGTHAVLHGVDLEVPEGEIVALLGLNGAGKSVTMKVAGGIVPAWEGRVTLDGSDIATLSVEQRVARGVGHVPQGRQLFPELTVEENLRLGGYLLRRHSSGEYRRRLADLYERFPRLDERRSQLAGSLSGGEQAMLAVARALINGPRLLMIDEPSAGLAPVIAQDAFELLRSVKDDSGVSMLLIEQNVALALQVADRIAVMRSGQVVYTATAGRIDRRRLNHELGIGRLLAGDRPNGSRKRGGKRRTSKEPAAKKSAAKKSAAKKP